MSYTWTTGEVITADKLNATGGGGDIFLLTFTLTEGNDGWEATCDKTFSEFATAIEENKIILGYFTYTGNEFYPVSYFSYDEQGCDFINYYLEMSAEDGELNVTVHTIFFNPDDSCEALVTTCLYTGTPL